MERSDESVPNSRALLFLEKKVVERCCLRESLAIRMDRGPTCKLPRRLPSSQRMNRWESSLDRAPDFSGKVSSPSNTRLNSGSWYSRPWLFQGGHTTERRKERKKGDGLWFKMGESVDCRKTNFTRRYCATHPRCSTVFRRPSPLLFLVLIIWLEPGYVDAPTPDCEPLVFLKCPVGFNRSIRRKVVSNLGAGQYPSI